VTLVRNTGQRPTYEEACRAFLKAYVVLKPGHLPRPALDDEIADVVKTNVGQYPRAVEFVPDLPKTETWKSSGSR